MSDMPKLNFCFVFGWLVSFQAKLKSYATELKILNEQSLQTGI